MRRCDLQQITGKEHSQPCPRVVRQTFQTGLYYPAILGGRMALSASQRLAPYEVVAQIGTGVMRDVSIKQARSEGR
jgi:hypothetical protein